MNRILFLFFLALCVSCKTVTVKENTYKVSNASTEIGSIGVSKTGFLENDFLTHAIPELENKIRVEVKLVPFTKKLNKQYTQKAKYNQNQANIQYVDSLDTKPEAAVINILDQASYVNELNANKNKEVLHYLKNNKKAKIITSIVLSLATENLSKIKQADSYYLANIQDSKYTLSLYKAGKKTETIDLQSGVVLGYELSKCCWSMDAKGNWLLADIVKEYSACNGTTKSKIKPKKTTKSLYKM